MISGPLKLAARCDSCRGELPYGQIAQAEYRMLLNGYYIQQFTAELRMLATIDDFFERNPSLRDQFDRYAYFGFVLHQEDPKIVKVLAIDVPVAEIVLESVDADDAEAISYLSKKNGAGRSGRRMQWLREKLIEYEANPRSVNCSHCQNGCLQLVEDVVNNNNQ